MRFRVNQRTYGYIVECQESKSRQWRKHENDGPYSKKTSAQSRMRALRKIDAERPDDLAARIMASRVFCAGVVC